MLKGFHLKPPKLKKCPRWPRPHQNMTLTIPVCQQHPPSRNHLVEVRPLDPQVLVIIIVSHAICFGGTQVWVHIRYPTTQLFLFLGSSFFWMVNILVLRFKLVQIHISCGWRACLMVESPVWCRIHQSILEHNLCIRKSTTLPIVMLVAHKPPCSRIFCPNRSQIWLGYFRTLFPLNPSQLLGQNFRDR